MRLCPWSLALASSIPVLGLERFCPRKGCPWPWPWPRIFFVSLALALASSLVSSTPPLVEAIVPSLVVHQGYDAKHPKDLPLAKTFGIWLPEDDGLSISDTLTLVSRCNAKISCTDLETKHSAKWNEGVLRLVSVQEPLLTTLKKLNYNPYAGYRRVQFQKKKSAKQFQNLETSSRSPKGDENL